MSKPIIQNISEAPAQQQEVFSQFIRSSLVRFNLDQKPNRSSEPLLLEVISCGKTAGGLVGRMNWDWLHIDLLWPAEHCRKRKLGRQLLLDAEKIARSKNCIGACTDTFSFQALEFYLKSGYQVFGKLDDQPAGETHYFLKKKLKPKKFSSLRHDTTMS